MRISSYCQQTCNVAVYEAMKILRRQFQNVLALLIPLMPVLPLVPFQPLMAADASSVVASSNAYAADIAKFEEQLADLESSFGAYDRSLLEPLQNLTELALEQSEYERVGELQNRQLQVLRTVLGFRHPEIVPLLQEIVTNEIRLGKWESVSDHLEHIQFLVSGDPENNAIATIDAMRQQAYWHLARVYLDEREDRARNFMEARELTDDLADLAKAEFGEDSNELIPSLYELALTEYRLVELMNADDGIAGDTIERLIRAEGVARLQLYGNNRMNVENLFGTRNYIPIVERGELIGEAYLRDAENTVKEIGEIAEKSGNLETQAMALIYAGDMQQVMGKGTSMRKYREARELLLEAGVDSAKIEKFFNQPSLIPYPTMFLTLDEALAYLEQGKQGIESLGTANQSSENESSENETTEDQSSEPQSTDPVHLGQLVAWQEGLPDVAMPIATAGFLKMNLAFNAVDATVSVSSAGKVSAVEVLAANPAEQKVEREASNALRDINVRPAIFEGRAKRLQDVHIRYLFLPEE